MVDIFIENFQQDQSSHRTCRWSISNETNQPTIQPKTKKNRSIDFCYEIVVDHIHHTNQKKKSNRPIESKSPTGVLSPCLCHNITWTYRHLYHCHLIITKKTLWETHRHRLNTNTHTPLDFIECRQKTMSPVALLVSLVWFVSSFHQYKTQQTNSTDPSWSW